MTMENSRRRFAKGMLGLGALACGSAGIFRLSSNRMSFQEALANVFQEADSAQAIGQGYLASVGGEPTAAVMMESVASALAVAPAKEVSTASLRVLLRRRIREDFRLGKTVSVQGWVLSVTEAQACAFVALNRGNVS